MRQVAIYILLFTSFLAYAQKEVKVSGTYTYNAPSTQSLEQAKILALQFAQAEAIAEAFGTKVMGQSSSITTDGKTCFAHISDAEVGGIWIKDLEKPIFTESFWNGGFSITCMVKGVAREIVSVAIPYRTRILCNGFSNNHERTDFKNGDKLYMTFQSPIGGYLCVYLLDGEQNVSCVLPYYNQSNGIYEIEANKEYKLFSEVDAIGTRDEPYVDEYNMVTSKDLETNVLYVVFSPNKFYKAVDHDGKDNQLRHLKYDDFNKWLGKCRREDKDMNVTKYLIDISK